MWPLAECISSTLVWTPSLQLGVLQLLRGSFQLVRSHPLTSLVHTSGGIQSEVTTKSVITNKRPKSGKREWTPLHEPHGTSADMGWVVRSKRVRYSPSWDTDYHASGHIHMIKKYSPPGVRTWIRNRGSDVLVQPCIIGHWTCTSKQWSIE